MVHLIKITDVKTTYKWDYDCNKNRNQPISPRPEKLKVQYKTAITLLI